MNNYLINKFVFIDHNDMARSGEVVGMACDHVYLVKLDPNENPPVSVLISVEDMLEAQAFFVFDTRDELETWLDWLEHGEGDDTHEVVHLKHVAH